MRKLNLENGRNLLKAKQVAYTSPYDGGAEEAQRCQLTCLRSHSYQVGELRLKSSFSTQKKSELLFLTMAWYCPNILLPSIA